MAHRVQHLLRSWHVEKIVEVLIASPQEGPDGAGTLVDVVHLSLAGAVPKEGPIEAGICVLHQFHLQHQEGDNCQGCWETVSPVYRPNVLHSSGMAHAFPSQPVTLLLSSLPHRAERGEQQESPTLK